MRPLLLTLALLIAVPLFAQAPPTPSPTPSPSPPPTAPPVRPATPAAADTPRCTAEEPCLTADRQEGLGQGHFKASGFVDLQFGDARIQADGLELITTAKPDGSEQRRILAEGNVVFLRGEERLSGRKLDMDLASGRGTFEDAVGYVEPGVFVEAKKIERVDTNKYSVHGAKFTSCAQPNPRWSFSASSATIRVDDRVSATNVLFKVKGVPAFYIPYFTYPIEQDQRSTGLLFPHFGQSTARGFNVGTGFFWAMGRTWDQTFYLDHYSKFGYGYGHEFRYLRKAPSRGTFRTYFFQRSEGGWEHDFNWSAIQLLPGKIKATLEVQESSTITFQEQFQDSFDYVSRRTRFSRASLQRNFGATSVQLMARSTDTFFGSEDTFDRRRQLPSLLVAQTPKKIAKTGLVFSYRSKAENLAFGNQDRIESYGRYDLQPRLSRPFSLSFLQFTPEAQVRYTAYGVSDTDPGVGSDLSGPAVNRRYFESSVDMRGPTFSRVFFTPGNFYSEKLKHVIGPEVRWTYRTRVDNFDEIPYFDGDDRVPGTNQIEYGLVQRLYAKRKSASGKFEPYEFMNWKVQQTYYVQTGASLFDPGYVSAPFGPTGEPTRFSAVKSRLGFRPTPRLSLSQDLEYDVSFKQLRSMSLTSSIDLTRVRLQTSWFRSNRLAVRVENRVVNRNAARASTRIELLPKRLVVEGSADYDFLADNLVQAMGRIRYDVQCCGFVAEVVQSDYNIKQDRQFRFAIELANIGSIGNFFGTEGQGLWGKY